MGIHLNSTYQRLLRCLGLIESFTSPSQIDILLSVVAELLKWLHSIMTVYINTNCLGNLYKIPLRLDENLTWGWLASESIRLALEQMEEKSTMSLMDMFSSFKLVKVTSNRLGNLNYGEEITKDKLTKIASSTIYVIVEGPFSSLSEKLLLMIAENYSDKAKDISKLCLLNRRFRLIFQADATWKDIVINYKWSGGGVDGTEQEEWNAYRIESGLPYFNTER